MAGTTYPTPRASGSLVISYGLVNVGVKYGPVLESRTRLSGKFIDPKTKQPVTQQYVNEAGKPVEKVTGYPHGDDFVVLSDSDAQALKAQRDGRLEIRAFVEPQNVDPLYFEKNHLVWPDKGHEMSYDVLCAVLSESGRYLVGTTTLDATRVVVLRCAQGCLFAHVLTYDASIRWGNHELVVNAIASRPAPDPALVDMAGQVFERLPETFELEGIVDDYDQRLRAAVEAAAAGLPVAKAPAIEDTPVADLMEALKASVAELGEKPAPKRSRKKVVA